MEPHDDRAVSLHRMLRVGLAVSFLAVTGVVLIAGQCWAGDELHITELVAGTGEFAAAEGDELQVRYSCKPVGGEALPGHGDGDGLFRFRIGSVDTIAGFQSGCIGMKEGGRRRVLVPASLGYGSEGSAVVPAGSALVFEIELVELIRPSSRKWRKTATGLRIQDLATGSEDGLAVTGGGTVDVHYTGWLEDGTKFDSSRDRDSSYSFVVGKNAVIPGWEEGLIGMTPGGRRRLEVPPTLAYGKHGIPGAGIPPKATLVYEIEVLGVSAPGSDNPTYLDPERLTVTASGLQFQMLREGRGAQPKKDDRILVEYGGWLPNGKKIAGSDDDGKPLNITVGSSRLIAGWREAIELLRVGGKIRVRIPPKLAYGNRAIGDKIPANSTLYYEIEIIKLF